MAEILLHKQLATGVIPASGVPTTIYTNPGGTIDTYVKSFYLHNNQSLSSDVAIFIDGTGTFNRVLNATLVSSETMEWDIAYNLTLTGTQQLWASSSIPSGINYFMYGATE
jgi:hypothetical protein